MSLYELSITKVFGRQLVGHHTAIASEGDNLRLAVISEVHIIQRVQLDRGDRKFEFTD